MRFYPAKFAAAVLAVLATLVGVLLFVRAPIAAEYWVREMILIKRDQARQLDSPKIVFLGGSSSLFGIDAAMVERELHIPTENFGLHAGMRLDWLLEEAGPIMNRGDVLILPLEQGYYDCESLPWTVWQLRNALAWHPAYLDELAPWRRIEVALATANGASLVAELLEAEIAVRARFPRVIRRLDALAPSEEIIDRYRSGKFRTEGFEYSAFNLDERGDMVNNVGTYALGPGDLSRPGRICPAAKNTLRAFVDKMKGRGVRTLFAHAPYVVDQPPAPDWQDGESLFLADVTSLGAELLDRRDELFMPSKLFFDTSLHLNEAGRFVRTRHLVDDLSKLGIYRKAP